MLLDMLQEANKECTGCAACEIICPKCVIQMEPDQEGFLKPCVEIDKCTECQLCVQTCPQLNMKKNNDPNPPCYAVKADDEILTVSSSGGAFTVLADYVFERGGYVCGAAFDEDFRGVSHIMISDKNDMYRLRGSKYVYSKPSSIYKEIKKKLDEGKWVLYCSTPCQVAALNSYLDPMKYDSLITVDLLCGGVPSEKLFKMYMDEISGNKKVSSVSFRPKKYGWNYSGIETSYEDGSTHMIHSMRDPYLKGFMNWLYVGNACANCYFAEPPRHGDFSIGDFWNISRFTDQVDDSNGVSCMLVNNKKSEKIFETIKSKYSFVKKMPLSFLKRFNRLQRVRNHHLARSRFFDLIRRGFPLEKAVDYSLNWKFDVALTGCWTVRNYGGELTYFALYNIIKDMGYTVIMVERRINLSNYDTPNPSIFNINPYPFYDISRIHKTFTDQRELNARVKNFVLGSDQVWNYELMREESIKSYTFDYVADYRKKICYATSFGMPQFTGNDNQKAEFSKLISSFDYLSVREKSGINILKIDFNLNAEWTIDPVFVVEKKHIEHLLNNANCKVNGQYVFTYFIHLNESKSNIETIANNLNMGLINTIDIDKVINNHPSLANWKYTYEGNCKLENWLYYLVNSSYIVTDSFHAICLSIVFKKPFIFIKGHLDYDCENGGRVDSILGYLGLKDRIADTVADAIDRKLYLIDIDYDLVYRILEPERERSLNWLKNAIDAEKQV